MAETDITRDGVLVTGPTRGLGRALVDALLDTHAGPSTATASGAQPARPLHLVLAGRDPVGLERVAADVRDRGGSAEVLVVDLADLRSVDGSTATVREAVATGRLPRLRAAVLNAGGQFWDRRHTSAQGHEETFAVNVLAQHALVRGLAPAVAPGGVVVLLGSSAHRGRRHTFGLLPSPVWRDPAELARPDLSPAGDSGTAGAQAYADSKLALVTLAHRWARELTDGPRLAVYDPGLVAGTGLARDMPAYRRWVWENLMPAMQVLPGAASARTSAGHLARLALGVTHADRSGAYVALGRETAPATVTLDEARQARLWDVCEELTRYVTA